MSVYIQKNCEAALSFLFAEHDLDITTQYKIVSDGYSNTRMFSKMARNEDKLETMAKDDFDVPDNKQGRLTITKLMVIWKACGIMGETDDKVRAEAKALHIPRFVDDNERDTLLLAYAAFWGEPEEEYIPTLGFLQLKMDEVEKGIHKATPLYEVTCGDFDDGGPPQKHEDMTGVVRYLKTQARASMPANVEELRHALRAEGMMWLFLKTRFYNRPFFHDLEPAVFSKHTDFLLSDRVYRLAVRTPGSGSKNPVLPALGHVLNYDEQIRKKAMKIWSNDKTLTYAACLKTAQDDLDLRTFEFTEKLTLKPKEWFIPGHRPQLETGKRVREDLNTGDQEPTSKRAKKRARAKAKAQQQQPGQRQQQQAQQQQGQQQQGQQQQGQQQSGREKKGWRHPDIQTKGPNGKEYCFNWNKGANCGGPPGCNRLHQCQIKGCNQQPPGHRTKECPLLQARGIVLN